MTGHGRRASHVHGGDRPAKRVGPVFNSLTSPQHGSDSPTRSAARRHVTIAGESQRDYATDGSSDADDAAMTENGPRDAAPASPLVVASTHVTTLEGATVPAAARACADAHGADLTDGLLDQETLERLLADDPLLADDAGEAEAVVCCPAPLRARWLGHADIALRTVHAPRLRQREPKTRKNRSAKSVNCGGSCCLTGLIPYPMAQAAAAASACFVTCVSFTRHPQSCQHVQAATLSLCQAWARHTTGRGAAKRCCWC